jgi:hypothetical protein
MRVANNWIEDAISKNIIKRYEYEDFSEIKKIAFGYYGKVYCANWKNSAVKYALKSFNLNIAENIEEIVNEVTSVIKNNILILNYLLIYYYIYNLV